MTFNWFKIFNRIEFQNANLVSRTYTVILGGIGQKDILVTESNLLGITYTDGDETFYLGLNLNGANPFIFEGHAIYIDDNDDVFMGIEIES